MDEGEAGHSMRDIEDSVILITGSTDGIGKLTARGLATRGATVLLHGRDPKKGAGTVREMSGLQGKVHYYNADLSSLQEVSRLAREVAEDHPQLDALVNNAGIGEGRPEEQHREESVDGLELRLAVNYLAPFLLTRLLVPALEAGAPSRIVNVASLSQRQLDLTDLMLKRRYDPQAAYGQSKLALVMLTFDLAEELQDENITVNALHPGTLLDTKMVRDAFGHGQGDPQSGAEAVMDLVASPRFEGVTGRFFERGEEVRAHPQAYDVRARRRLRDISLELIRRICENALPGMNMRAR